MYKINIYLQTYKYITTDIVIPLLKTEAGETLKRDRGRE